MDGRKYTIETQDIDVSIPLTTLLCVLLITLCSASDNSSSNKPRDKNTQQTSSYGTCGHLACFCAPGIPGIPGSPGPAGSVGAAGSPGNHGPEGPMGPRGNKGDGGARGSQGPQGPNGPKGPAGQPGNKGDEGGRGIQGPPGTKGAKGPSGPPGRKGDEGARGRQGLQGPKGPKGPSGLQGPPGSMARNWKQCTFKNINDDKDSGLIKECVFKKKSDKTALRVYWAGNLRLYNCHGCCRRWYFTFNGAECSAPAAIDGVVYMVHGNGSKKNLHRPRHIEGVCEKLRKGTVRVGFWVGNCHFYRSADAYTGWNSVSRIYVEEILPPQA